MPTFTYSPRLFALLIGINTYNGEASSTASQPRASSAVNFPPFPNLRSALSDAEKFNNYLIADLKVHKDHITFLRDTEATRDRIIGAFKNLADDERIVKGDAIFVFYAGHGAQALPPKSMINKEGCPEKVELLLPHDYNHFPGNQENMGIPDYTLGALINKISKKKGDNIVRVPISVVTSNATACFYRQSCSTVVILRLLYEGPWMLVATS